MAKININELDFKRAGSWPTPVKMVSYAIVAVGILAAGYWFLLSPQQDTLAAAEKKEETLKEDFEKKALRAAKLEPLTDQLIKMEDILAEQLRQLPNRTQMPALILDVTRIGISSGLNIQLFEPQTEQVKEFYAERPIKVKMVGTYHEFGEFVSGVASLPRVMIMASQDLSLKPNEPETGQSILDMELTLEGTVKTYRSLDEAEQSEQEKIAEEARKKAAADRAKEEAARRRAARNQEKKDE